MPDGRLAVTWRTPGPPSSRLTVVVDGVDVGKVRYGKPATFTLPSGPHDVVLRSPRYSSRRVRVEVTDQHIDLFGGVRRPPTGLSFRHLSHWSKDNALWLNTEQTPPTPPNEPPITKGLLGFRVASIIFFSLVAVGGIAGGSWIAVVIAGALVAVGVGRLRTALAERRRQPSIRTERSRFDT